MKLTYKLCYLSTLLLYSAVSAALEVKVIDQKGNAVSQAIVSIKSTGKNVQPPAKGETAIMDQIGKRFVPHVLPVRAGTRVSFPNSDNIRHNVYSFSPAKKFQIKLYSGEPSTPVLFDSRGVVVLGCNIHDVMKGFIYVLDTPIYAQTNETGIAQLDYQIKEQDELEIWHPDLKVIDQPALIPLTEINSASAVYEVAIKLHKKRKYREPKSALEKKFQSMRN